MRKLLFVLLFILLITASGCRAEKTLPNDTGASIPDISTEEIRETEKPPESDSSSVSEETSLPEETETTPVPAQPQEPAETVPPKQTETEAPKQTIPGTSTDPTEKAPVQTESPTPEPEPEDTKPSAPETVPPETGTVIPPEESTDPPPADIEAEYKRIIREATAYAESYAVKGFTFHWNDSLDFNWETGYMGTPRVKYEGVDGVIRILKHHIDRIVQTATDPGNGIPASAADYKVMQITVDGDIAFVVLYG